MDLYTKGSQLGEGGFRAAFKCADRKTNKELAMKVIPKLTDGLNSEEIKRDT